MEIAAAILGALPWLVLWWNQQHAWLCGVQSMCASVAPLFFPLGAVQAVAIALFSWVLLFIFLYDLRYQIILDRVTLPAIVLAIFMSRLLFDRTWQSVLIGMLIGGGVFALQFIVSRGRWIGGGDIRMGLLMGALLGLYSTIAALFVSYIVGAAVAAAPAVADPGCCRRADQPYHCAEESPFQPCRDCDQARGEFDLLQCR